MQEASVSVRLNPFKGLAGPEGTPVPWSPYGRILSGRPAFTLDPLFHAGCYYVQDSSAMFVGYLFRKLLTGRGPLRVLDLCAAPGGKTTDLAASLRGAYGDGFVLVANEVMKARVGVLDDNVARWGDPNVVVTSVDPGAFARLAGWFDIIVADVPCSGEGMFRKDPRAVEEWSLENVQFCAARSRRILTDIWPTLAPGGILLYSTCTFNLEENDHNAAWIADELGADVLPVAMDPQWKIVEMETGYHFFPHLIRGEGFYVCALRKQGDAEHFMPYKCKETKKTSKPVDGEEDMRLWLKHPEHWFIRQYDHFMTAYPLQHKDLIESLGSQLTCISTGFGIGELRGKHVAPQHALAMAKDVNMDAFPVLEADYETALSYLRTEALQVDVRLPLGSCLLSYEGVPLGFAKNVGNRLNNAYPHEWRIRKL